MRRIAFVLACVGIAIGGCGQSPEKKAADRIRTQVDLARRHYLRGVGLLSETPELDKDDPAAPVAERPAALKAFLNAEKVLKQALSDSAGATTIGKAPAESMLARVNLAIGDYHAALGRALIQKAMAGAHTSGLQLDAAEGLAGLADFLAKLSAMDPAQAESRQAETAARVQEFTAKQKRLQLHLVELNEQVDALVHDSQSGRTEAAKLRNASQTAKGRKSLDLLAEASRIEGQVDQTDRKVNDLKFEAETSQTELQLVTRRLASANARLVTTAGHLADFKSRAATNDQRRAGLDTEIQKISAKLAEGVAKLAGEFTSAVDQYDLAVGAYGAAERANRAALSGVKAQQVAARKAKEQAKGSTAEPILDWMSGNGELVAPTAQKGQIALASADAQRDLLEATRHLETFGERVRKVVRAIGMDEGIATDVGKALALVTKNLPERKEQARTGYNQAREAFARIDDKRLLVNKPVNVTATKWIYQAGQAQALMGLYWLTVFDRAPNAEYLHKARNVVNEVLKRHPGRSEYLRPIHRLDREIKAIDSMGAM